MEEGQKPLEECQNRPPTMIEAGASIAAPEEPQILADGQPSEVSCAQAAETKPEEATPTERDAPYNVLGEAETKYLIVAASFAATISPFSTGIYYPAVNALSRDLGVSVALINLTISTYQIFQGIAPSVTAAFSDSHGRRPAYMLCFIIYFGANLGLALQNDYAALLVLRCLQSAGSSGTVALAVGVVSDLSTRAHRGKYMVYATIGTILGPALGPVVGGLLSQYLGWRAIFWFLLILSGVIASVMAVVFRETSRAVVGNGSVPPPRWNRSLLQLISEEFFHKPLPPADVETLEKRRRSVHPFRSVQILFDKESCIIIVYAGILYAGYAAVSAILSSQLHVRYGLDEVQIGLCYIPLGIGSMTARWTVSFLMDWNFRREAKKQGLPIVKDRQQDISQFDIEKARLAVALPFVLGGCCCILAYGWTMEYRTPLAPILVILFFTANIMSGSLIPLGALLLDINPQNSATTGAAVNLVRCLLSAGAVAAATPLIDAIGIGWTSSLTVLLWVAFAVAPLVVYCNGYRWRVANAAKPGNREMKAKTKDEQRAQK